MKIEHLLCNYGLKTQEVYDSMMSEGVEVPKCEAFLKIGLL